MTDADMWTVETYDPALLCIGRWYDGDKLFGIFNFSEQDRTAWISEKDGEYMDLISGQKVEASALSVPAYGFFWLKKIS